VRSAQDKFDSLAGEEIWPALEAHGFKRSKATFHRPRGPNWQVVNLQKDRGSTPQEVRFTLNLAIGLDSLRDGVRDWKEGRRPAESRCHIRERLGSLMSDEDVWWTITRFTREKQLAETILGDLERYGLPWLDACSDDDRLAAIAADPSALRAASGWVLHPMRLLMEKRGDRELAQAVAREMARRRPALQP
jgi:hypothetical protein